MPAFSQTISSVASTTPATRPMPPVMATPPSTAMVIAGRAIPLPETPASGRAEANWATVTTATSPEISPA